jgi:NADH-quinone oxidoreductase subunit K
VSFHVSLQHSLALGAILFMIGMLGVLTRKNVIIVLMSIELMLNAANLTVLAFARARHDMTGHALAFIVIAVAAAEAAVGLAVLVGIFRTRRTSSLDEITMMKH